MIFQDLVHTLLCSVWFFALWSSVLGVLKANGKYNVKLGHLIRQYQITSVKYDIYYTCINVYVYLYIYNIYQGSINDSWLVFHDFTNHILAESKYFTNHIKWTEHSIMVLNPANKRQIIWQYRSFKSIFIDSFHLHPFLYWATGKIIETIYYCISPHITSISRVPWRKRKQTFKTVLRARIWLI